MMTNTNSNVIEESSATELDCKGSLAVIWSALHGYREDCISKDDDQWEDIVLAMQWVEHALNETQSSEEHSHE